MDAKFLFPNDLDPNEHLLNSCPGIWFVTADAEGELVVTASENYWQKARGNWHSLPPKKLPNGLVVNWLIRPLWFQTGKVMP
jgi:uncharacterized protein YceK